MKYFLSADWHGDIAAFNTCYHSLPKESSTVILLGDIGIRYGNLVNSMIEEKMGNTNHTWIIMRGNHDKRYVKYAKEHKENWKIASWGNNEVWFKDKYPNILYIKDEGDIYNIANSNCLFIPGGWSIDGIYRQIAHLAWEYDEELSMEEQRNLYIKAINTSVDYVFSHDCPYSWQSELKDFFIQTRISPKFSMNLFMDTILKNVKPIDKWFFGHYHGRKTIANGKGELVHQSAILFKEL